MREVLRELNKNLGVRGSMISTRDGIVVAAELEMGLEEEVLAAVISSLISLTRKAFGHLNLGDCQRVVLSFAEGRLILVESGEALLLVVTRPETNLGLILLEVDQAARRLVQEKQVTA